MPALSTCSFTPNQVSSGSGDTNVRLNIVTTAASGVTARLTGTPDQLWFGLGFSLVGLVLAFGRSRTSARSRNRVATLLVILSLLPGTFVACGGGGSSGGGGGGSGGAGHPGTAPGNYTITVNGVVGSVTRSAQVTLTVQ